jgi:Reverse transcriptase (RNA-dependent DNA polymerase)
MEWGFMQTSADLCVYIRTNKEGKCTLGLHVDDFVVARGGATISTFKNEMHSCYKIKDLGVAKLVVGLQITQDGSGITISQSTYVKSVLQGENMDNSHPSPVLLTGGEVNATITDKKHEPANPTLQTCGG